MRDCIDRRLPILPMMIRYLPLLLLPLLFAGVSTQAADAEPTTAKPVTAELICGVRKFAPGERFTVGIRLRHQPGFHTYWHSPGTVGLATIVGWELPPGYKVGELQWPVPERCQMEGYNTHGYNRDVTLLAEVTAPADAKPGPITIKATLTWMACSKSKCCNLQHGTEGLQLVCGTEAVADDAGAKLITAARRQLPQPYSGVTSSFSQSRDAYTLIVGFPAGAKLPAASTLYFYGDGQLVDSIRAQQIVRTKTGYQLTLPRTDYGPENPEEMTGLLFSSDKWPGTEAQHLPLEAKRVGSATSQP